MKALYIAGGIIILGLLGLCFWLWRKWKRSDATLVLVNAGFDDLLRKKSEEISRLTASVDELTAKIPQDVNLVYEVQAMGVRTLRSKRLVDQRRLPFTDPELIARQACERLADDVLREAKSCVQISSKEINPELTEYTAVLIVADSAY